LKLAEEKHLEAGELYKVRKKSGFLRPLRGLVMRVPLSPPGSRMGLPSLRPLRGLNSGEEPLGCPQDLVSGQALRFSHWARARRVRRAREIQIPVR